MTRFARPLLRLFGAFRAPEASTSALTALLSAIPRDPSEGEALRVLLEGPLDQALVELEQDLARAERSIVVHGELPSGHATWLARRLRAMARVAVAIEPGAREAIEDALLELADLEEARHREVLGGGAGEGAVAGGGASDGESGRHEALRGEDRALARRFARWFGDAKEEGGSEKGGTEEEGRELSRPSEEATDVDALRMVLVTVAEVISELGGRDEARLVDAIDLAERLLREARIAPSRYAELVASYPELVAQERAAVRRAARPWGSGVAALLRVHVPRRA